MMARFARAAVNAASATGGLVDATLLDEIEDAGYRGDNLRAEVPLFVALIRHLPASLLGRSRSRAGAISKSTSPSRW